MPRFGGWILFAVTLAPLCACEAVVGDLGNFTDSCNPAEDRCPGSAPCSYDFKLSVFKCVARKGTKDEDNVCDLETDCSAGLTCARFKNNSVSHCARYCQGPTVCATDVCYDFDPKRIVSGGNSAGACGPLETACDPLGSSSSCGTGRRCMFFDTDYTKCITLSATPVDVGEKCEYLNDCTPGSTCFGSDAAGYKCVQLCDFDSPSCPGSTMCQEFPGMPRMLGSMHLGLCR